MKRSLLLSLCAALLAAVSFTTAQASDVAVTLDLELSDASDASGGGEWTLWARIDNPDTGVDGSIGLAAVNAIINGIDFGTDGDAITIASGNGAIDPVPTDGGDRPPVLDVGGGTVDLIYGQDIANGPVVTGVGVNPDAPDSLLDTLIASGTYSGDAPTFTSAGSSETDVNLLTSETAPTSAAVPSDSVATNVVTLGDLTGEGIVSFADIDPFVTEVLAGSANFASDIDQSGIVTFADIDPFVNIVLGTSSTAAVAAVPEPASVLLLGIGALTLVNRRRRLNK